MTALEIAKKYKARNMEPIPIPFKQKAPTETGWPDLDLSEDDLSRYFNGKDQNIGIHLTNGWTDLDLDWQITIKIADFFLPPTDAVFGRAGKNDRTEFTCARTANTKNSTTRS